MNDYVFDSKDEAMKMAKKIGLKDVHEHKTGDGKTMYMPGKNMEEFQAWYDKHSTKAPYHYKKKVDEDESNAAVFVYEDPQSGELYHYSRRGLYKKNGRTLVFVKKARSEYIDVGEKSEAAEYQGRKVQLNKPFRTSKGPKKFSVYVKNEKGNVVKVNFGDPNMEIKRDDPDRRKSNKMGFKGRIPAHQVKGGWLPGPTPKDLEDWCKKNCKPAKQAKQAKPIKAVEEKIITPAIGKSKIVSSNKNSLNKNSASKDEKKD